MERNEEVVHSCCFSKSALCVKSTCRGIEYDPKSSCHSICANPHRVCSKPTCKKYVKNGKEEEKYTICLPTQTCRLTSRFGLEQSDSHDTLIIGRNREDVNDAITDMQITEKKVPEQRRDKKMLEETAHEKANKLLDELALHLNDDQLSRVISLGGSGMCPCCACRVCICNQLEESKLQKSKTTRTNKKILPPETKNTKITQHISKTSSWKEMKTQGMYGGDWNIQNGREEYPFSNFEEYGDDVQMKEEKVQNKEMKYRKKTENNRIIQGQMPNSGSIGNIQNKSQKPNTENKIQNDDRTKIATHNPASKFVDGQSNKDAKNHRFLWVHGGCENRDKDDFRSNRYQEPLRRHSYFPTQVSIEISSRKKSSEESIQNICDGNVRQKKNAKKNNPNTNSQKAKKVQDKINEYSKIGGTNDNTSSLDETTSKSKIGNNEKTENSLQAKDTEQNLNSGPTGKMENTNIRSNTENEIQNGNDTNAEPNTPGDNVAQRQSHKDTKNSDSIENIGSASETPNKEVETQNDHRAKKETNNPGGNVVDSQSHDDTKNPISNENQKMDQTRIHNSDGNNQKSLRGSGFIGDVENKHISKTHAEIRNDPDAKKEANNPPSKVVDTQSSYNAKKPSLNENHVKKKIGIQTFTAYNKIYFRGPNSNRLEGLAGGMPSTEHYDQNEKVVGENNQSQSIDQKEETSTSNRKSDALQSQSVPNNNGNLNEKTETNLLPSGSFNSETKGTTEEVNETDIKNIVETRFSTDKSATFQDSTPVSDLTFSTKHVTETQETPQNAIFNKAEYKKESIDMAEMENEESLDDLNREFSNTEPDFKPQINDVKKSIRDTSALQKSKFNDQQKKQTSIITQEDVVNPQQRIDSDEFDNYVAWQSESLGELIPIEMDLHIKNTLNNKMDFSFASDTDICNCIPGYCSCGKQHYLFKKIEKTEDLIIIPTTPPNRESNGTLFKKSFSYASSCSCDHDSSYGKSVNPKLSRVEVVAFPPEKPTRIQKSGKSCKPPRYQRTLLIVKPEAVRFKDVILRTIGKEGLDIIDQRFVHLTPEQVSEIYTENYGSSYFALFVQQMSSSPVLVLSIGGFNSIERWNELIGEEKMIPSSWFYPSSVKRRFGIHKDVFDAMRLSDDFERAQFEIRYFFPFGIVEPIIVDSFEVVDYCEKFIHPTLLKGLYALVKDRPPDPLMYLAKWILINNPYQPHFEDVEVALAPI